MKFVMNLSNESYPIILKNGVLEKMGALTDLIHRKVLIVTDFGVPIVYAKTIESQCINGFLLQIEQGETAKSLETLQQILQTLIQAQFTRYDLLVAVGGGVVGDLVGFAAACYMRGISWIHCPTTTLAQIDASIGGKTGIDFCGIKNVIGAFHQPQLVLIDPQTLKTLPRRHLANGLAEAVKAGLIGDESLFEMMEKSADAHLEQIISRALLVKKHLVEQDPKEQHLRKALNFGHTIGHAIESASDGTLYHGECVAWGMLAMLYETPHLYHRVRKVLSQIGLSMDFFPYEKEEIIPFLKHDKKALTTTEITIVKVDEIGSFRLETVCLEKVEKMVCQLIEKERVK